MSVFDISRTVCAFLMTVGSFGCTSDEVARAKPSPFIIEEEEEEKKAEVEPVTPVIERGDILTPQPDECFPEQDREEEFVVMGDHTYVLHSLDESISHQDPCLQDASKYFITNIGFGFETESDIRTGQYSSLHHMLKIDIWSAQDWRRNRRGENEDKVWIGGRVPFLYEDGVTHLFECDREARRQVDRALYTVNGVYIMCPGGDSISVHYPLYTHADDTYVNTFYTHLDGIPYEDHTRCSAEPSKCGSRNAMQAVALTTRSGGITLYEIDGYFTSTTLMDIEGRTIERRFVDEHGVTQHFQHKYRLGASRFTPSVEY